MRPFILALLLMTGVAASYGQVLMSLILGDKLNSGKVEFGLEGGANFPDIRELQDSDAKAFFNMGFYFDIKTKNPNWLFHTGVVVKGNLGAVNLPVYPLGDPNLDSAFANGDVTRKINYFSVPFMMKRKFGKRFYAEAGIMPALRYTAFDFFTADVQNADDLEYSSDTKDDYHRIDFGLAGGIGYRLMGGNGMNLGLRYYYGLVDITIDDSTADQYNSCLYLALGIPIGVAKARAREEQKQKQQ